MLILIKSNRHSFFYFCVCFDQAKLVFYPFISSVALAPLPFVRLLPDKRYTLTYKETSTHEYTLTCKEMSTHPRKSSTLAPPLFFLERADCATCLKKRLRPFSPDTSFSFLAASITENSSSWSLHTCSGTGYRLFIVYK